jgi:CheY-like chemotaxis protein
MEAHPHFLVIDDDPINNMICTHTIKSATGDNVTRCFTIPEEGLEYIENEFAKKGGSSPTILFLDINMPSMTGWDVLDKLKGFADQVKKNVSIYILSSSVSQLDQELAYNNPLVTDYIVKPLTKDKLLQILKNSDLRKAG